MKISGSVLKNQDNRADPEELLDLELPFVCLLA